MRASTSRGADEARPRNRLIQDLTTGTNAHNYTYLYDPNDNTLSSTESGAYVSSTFDAANRLLVSVGTAGNTTYQYSMEGTQTQVSEPPGGTLYNFTQDVEYRLASQTATPGGTRNWYYDANGKMQYYSGPSPAGTVTLIWDFDDYMEIWS